MTSVSIIVLICIFAGCQPTPGQSFVVGKSEELMNEAIKAENTDSVQYQAPEKLRYQGEAGGVELSIDADVKIPAVAAFSVYKTKPAEIGQEEAGRLAGRLHITRPVLQKRITTI